MSNGQITVPPEIEDRLKAWGRYFHGASIWHYILGVTGVIASTLAAAQITDWVTTTAGIVSAAAMAIIGFVRPETRYTKFVRAWRILDIAVMRFKSGLLDLKGLIDQLERAEDSIGEAEQPTKQK